MIADFWRQVQHKVQPAQSPGRLKQWLILLQRRYPRRTTCSAPCAAAAAFEVTALLERQGILPAACAAAEPRRESSHRMPGPGGSVRPAHPRPGAGLRSTDVGDRQGRQHRARCAQQGRRGGGRRDRCGAEPQAGRAEGRRLRQGFDPRLRAPWRARRLCAQRRHPPPCRGLARGEHRLRSCATTSSVGQAGGGFGHNALLDKKIDLALTTTRGVRSVNMRWKVPYGGDVFITGMAQSSAEANLAIAHRAQDRRRTRGPFEHTRRPEVAGANGAVQRGGRSGATLGPPYMRGPRKLPRRWSTVRMCSVSQRSG